jgi:hypothetical protein
MRYSIYTENKNNPSDAITDGTVVFTLFTGIIFLYVGIKVKKNWVKFWGFITIISCVGYFIIK